MTWHERTTVLAQCEPAALGIASGQQTLLCLRIGCAGHATRKSIDPLTAMPAAGVGEQVARDMAAHLERLH